MELKEIINRLEDWDAVDLVDFLWTNNISFDVFSIEIRQAGGWDSAEKRNNVKSLLKKKDDDAYNVAVSANTVNEFKRYLLFSPNINHRNEAESKMQKIQNIENAEIQKLKERERMLLEIKENINNYTLDEIIKNLGSEVLDDLCNELGIDAQMIKGFKEPTLEFNDIPKSESDIPAGYTDVFFWGIPSSGKTCALAAILSTIKKDFSMEAPDCNTKFGTTYRDSLINIFDRNYGYLPDRTNKDRTQYMPFLFFRRGEKNKRKISFFELSGEVVEHFYNAVNEPNKLINDDSKEDIEKSFQTLELLLKSDNQKIHYFFIDYIKETKHTNYNDKRTQSNYLEAAVTYFRDNSEIFKKRTDAVYVIVTKSDEIKGADRTTIAKSFLSEYFGSFMDVLKNQCDEHSVDFKVKLFSIGDVYFKKICIINRAYSTDIINDLLERVKPVRYNKVVKYLRS